MSVCVCVFVCCLCVVCMCVCVVCVCVCVCVWCLRYVCCLLVGVELFVWLLCMGREPGLAETQRRTLGGTTCLTVIMLMIIMIVIVIIIGIVYIYIYIYVHIYIHMYIRIGCHYLSNAPCLIRPRSCYAQFVVSRITMIHLPHYSPMSKTTCVRQAVLDK